MKKFMLVPIVVSAMAMGLASSSHAVQLQQGWYAWFAGVYVEGPYNPSTGEPYYGTWWHPATTLGQCGPLDIGLWADYPSSRMATVRGSTDVAPSVLFEDAGTSALSSTYFRIRMTWETDYDAAKMRLRLLRRRAGSADELLWEQPASGHQVSQVGAGPVWSSYSSPLIAGDRLVFSVTAVPEPGTATTLALGLGMLCCRMRRRRR